MCKRYCSIYDAYFKKDKWLESKCCTEPNSDCYFRCWERPDTPCLNCKMENECPEYKEKC